MKKYVSILLTAVLSLALSLCAFAQEYELEPPTIKLPTPFSNTGNIVQPDNTSVFSEKFSGYVAFEWDWTFSGNAGHQAVYFADSSALSAGGAGSVPIAVGADGGSFVYYSGGWKKAAGTREAKTYKAKIEIDTVNSSYSWYMDGNAVASDCPFSVDCLAIDAMGKFDAWSNTDRHSIADIKVDAVELGKVYPYARYYKILCTGNGQYIKGNEFGKVGEDIELYRYGDLFESDIMDAMPVGMKLKSSGEYIKLDHNYAHIGYQTVVGGLMTSTSQRFVFLKSESWSQNHLAYKIYHPKSGYYLGYSDNKLVAYGTNAPAYDFVITPSGLTNVGQATLLPGYGLLSESEQRRFVEIFCGVGPDSLFFDGGSSGKSITDRTKADISALNTLSEEEQAAKMRELMDLNAYNGQSNKYSIPALPGAGNITTSIDEGIEGEYDFWRGTVLKGKKYVLTVTGDGHEHKINFYVQDNSTAQNNANTFRKAIVNVPWPIRRYITNAYIRNDSANNYNTSMHDFYMRLNFQPDVNSVTQYLCHEFAHSLDQANGVVSGGGWASAVKSDIFSVSGYGDNNASEDFAEFTRMYFQAYGNINRMYAVRQIFPARYKMLASLLNNVGYSDIYKVELDPLQIVPTDLYELKYVCDGRVIGTELGTAQRNSTVKIFKGTQMARKENGEYRFYEVVDEVTLFIERGGANSAEVVLSPRDSVALMLNSCEGTLSVPEDGFEGRFVGWGNARGTLVILSKPKELQSANVVAQVALKVGKWHTHNGGKGGTAAVIPIDTAAALKAACGEMEISEFIEGLPNKDSVKDPATIKFAVSNDNTYTTNVLSTEMTLSGSELAGENYVAFLVAVQDMTERESSVTSFYENAQSGMTTFGNIELLVASVTKGLEVTSFSTDGVEIYTARDLGAELIVSVMDEDGGFLEAKRTQAELKSGTNKIALELSLTEEAAKVKAMLWKAGTMMPLCESYEEKIGVTLPDMTSSGQSKAALHSLEPMSDKAVYTFEFVDNGSNDSGIMLGNSSRLNTSSTNYFADGSIVLLFAKGELYTRDASAKKKVASYGVGERVKVRIEADIAGNTYDLYVNDSLVASKTAFRSTASELNTLALVENKGGKPFNVYKFTVR